MRPSSPPKLGAPSAAALQLQRELRRLRAGVREPLADAESEARRLERLSEAPAALGPEETILDEEPASDVRIVRDAPLSGELYELVGATDLETPLPRDPRRRSTTPEGTLGRETEPVDYFEDQHATWRRLLALQLRLTTGRCAPEYAHGREQLQPFSDEIPALRDVDRWLESRCGWRVVRAAGYVQPRRFFAMLAERRFPCMDEIRHADEILYSPAPDIYHDIVGHLPMLQDPRFSEYYAVFGRAGTRARHEEQVEALNRIYWFTMEFGMVARGDDVMPYGAALLTGLAELVKSRGEQIERRPFDLGEVVSSPTDVSRPNVVLFVTPSYDVLLDTFLDWARSEKLL